MISSTPKYGLINHAKNVIMLIEDNVDHAELVARMIAEHPIPVEIFHFQDGTSALDFLFRRNDSHDRDASLRPQLILLDLHLPGIDGIEILRTIQATDELRAISVVMLTTSATDGEIARAYSNHANSYLVKPIGSDELKELIHVLCSYWFGKNRSPKICVAIDEVQHAPIAPQFRSGDYQTKTASTVGATAPQRAEMAFLHVCPDHLDLWGSQLCLYFGTQTGGALLVVLNSERMIWNK